MFKDFLSYYNKFQDRYEAHYEKFKKKLLNLEISDSLKSFLFYTPDSKGKLLRSFFAYRSCELFEIPSPIKENVALAIELFQSFTLIHDDLPSLDNDDYRRGKESLHKVVGEANAILIGDALSILPFLLFSDFTNSKSIKDYYPAILRFINEFSAFAVFALIDGQILDLQLNKEKIMKNEDNKNIKDNLKDKIFKIYEKKTASFFAFSLSSGALLKPKDKEDDKIKEYLELYDAGLNFGLAFQLMDDIDDYEKGKENFSFPNLFGLDLTKIYIKDYLKKSLKIIEIYDNDILYPYFSEFFKKFS